MKQAIFFLAFLLGPISAQAAISGKDLFTGKAITVASGKAGTALIFLSAKCPCSNSHVPHLKDLQKQYPEIAFVVVHSNADESREKSAPYFKAADFSFPVIQDSELKLAEEFKALKTPHAFLLKPDGKIAYKGGVTDSADASQAQKFYLKDALADLSGGKAVKVANGRTLGCVIKR